MKHEWRKDEKEIYVPKTKPEIVEIPAFQYFSIEGKGNPNGEAFSECVGVLYALSYGVKMGYKKARQPNGYCDYTVYPLEGVWDICDEAKKQVDYLLNKDDLVYKLMIRQPNFVDAEYVAQVVAATQKKKPHTLLSSVKFETIREGTCIQMLHLGSYDDEPASFQMMEQFAELQNLRRLSKVHKEIYLTDATKTAPEKLKTVLRFWVEK